MYRVTVTCHSCLRGSSWLSLFPKLPLSLIIGIIFDNRTVLTSIHEVYCRCLLLEFDVFLQIILRLQDHMMRLCLAV